MPLCAACHGKVHGHALEKSKLTKDALHAKRAKKEKTGGGVPFGFDLVGCLLVENQAEQRTLHLMESLRVRGYGYLRIAKYLNTNSLLTKTGREWQPAMVRQVYLRFFASIQEVTET